VHRESQLVELVTDDGVAVGQTTVQEAHQAPGQLHRAFSVLLIAPDGRLLLQQRAAAKTRFPLRWANACCGHPGPGAELTTSASTRLAEELGVTGVALDVVGVHAYRATDPITGRVEYEYDHVLVGRVPLDIPRQPDPAEVADVRWVAPNELRAGLDAEPTAYAPWLAGVIALLPEGAGDR
jgi:isopentenyl-diphosphate delta-isomerase